LINPVLTSLVMFMMSFLSPKRSSQKSRFL
jgi:hypothetical protein